MGLIFPQYSWIWLANDTLLTNICFWHSCFAAQGTWRCCVISRQSAPHTPANVSLTAVPLDLANLINMKFVEKACDCQATRLWPASVWEALQRISRENEGLGPREISLRRHRHPRCHAAGSQTSQERDWQIIKLQDSSNIYHSHTPTNHYILQRIYFSNFL